MRESSSVRHLVEVLGRELTREPYVAQKILMVIPHVLSQYCKNLVRVQSYLYKVTQVDDVR